jgi:hypothetical protein
VSAAIRPAPPNDFLWSDAEVARAKQLRREGGTHPAVAAKTVQRECLASGRGHYFDSEGPHHRICDACKRLGVFGS